MEVSIEFVDRLTDCLCELESVSLLFHGLDMYLMNKEITDDFAAFVGSFAHVSDYLSKSVHSLHVLHDDLTPAIDY